MGWASASEIVAALIEVVQDNVAGTDPAKKKIYKVIYDKFTEHDWDTVDEVFGIDPEFDKVVIETDPETYGPGSDDDEEED